VSELGYVEPGGVPPPPRGARLLKRIGPGLVGMMAAAGPSALYFAHRIAFDYGLLWLGIFAFALACLWFAAREIGRFTVCTGLHCLTRPDGSSIGLVWVLRLITFLQLAVAPLAIAYLLKWTGLSLGWLFPAPGWVGATAAAVLATSLILWNRHGPPEAVISLLLIVVATALLCEAIFAPGMLRWWVHQIVQLPAGATLGQPLSWLDDLFPGGAWLIWYSFWLQARGHGGAEVVGEQDRPGKASVPGSEERSRLRNWLPLMTLNTSIAIVGAFLLALATGPLILGATTLVIGASEAMLIEVPSGGLTADSWLALLFNGRGWFLASLVIGLAAHSTGLILCYQVGSIALVQRSTRSMLHRSRLGLSARKIIGKATAIGYVACLPIFVLAIPEPTRWLWQAGSTLDLLCLSLLAVVTVARNRRILPSELQPSRLEIAAVILAGLFFVGAAVFSVHDRLALWRRS
jgi:hypothetical protein